MNISEQLLREVQVRDVNAHLHTPFSFSAFDSIPQALTLAAEQGVKVVGINDFYSMEGYTSWKEEAISRQICPMFNIEFISLNSEDQAAGIRVNDPNNPGRTYISGKGLACPVTLKGERASQLADVRNESNAQVAQMCVKVEQIFRSLGIEASFDFETIKTSLTKGLVRERHLAKAIRIKVYELLGESAEAIEFYQRLFGGKPLKSLLTNHAALENEIRGNLLKAGGAAFVPEDPKAFLPMETVRQIILSAGGIPTYPFLADDAKGGFTDFEGDLCKAATTLKARGFHSVEFITTRNSVNVLEQYAEYLFDQGFVVTFGSEHNTPAMEPIKLFTREGMELTNKLKTINYCSACIIVAHQHRVANGQQGYLNPDSTPKIAQRDEFIALGDQIIKSITL